MAEIAFTIAFILLLLVGLMYAREVAKNNEARDSLRREYDGRLAAAKQVEARVAAALQRAGYGEDMAVRIFSDKATEEAARLQIELDATRKKLSTLVSIEELATRIRGQGRGDQEVLTELDAALKLQEAVSRSQIDGSPTTAEVAVERVAEALAIREKLVSAWREEAGDTGKQTDDAVAVKEALRWATSKSTNNDTEALRAQMGALSHKLSDATAQVVYLQGRLSGPAGKGMDHPPCWADSNGKVESLVRVTIVGPGLQVQPAWPERRADDARKLEEQGLLRFIRRFDTQDLSTFQRSVAPLYALTVQQGCRHYARISYDRDKVKDIAYYNRYRRGVQQFFYPLEEGL